MRAALPALVGDIRQRVPAHLRGQGRRRAALSQGAAGRGVRDAGAHGAVSAASSYCPFDEAEQTRRARDRVLERDLRAPARRRPRRRLRRRRLLRDARALAIGPFRLEDADEERLDTARRRARLPARARARRRGGAPARHGERRSHDRRVRTRTRAPVRLTAGGRADRGRRARDGRAQAGDRALS